MWEDFSQTVGFWADMKHPYVTYENTFIESEWWSLKQIYDRGLLYKGFKIVPYCPRCGTPLSSHEVAQGYKDIKERSAIARFKVVGEDAYFLAWTTTPWTLPSNVALCVHPDHDYVKVKTNDGYTYYLAAALADTVLGAGNYEVLEHFRGTDLEGKAYEPLFDFAGDIIAAQGKKAYYVVCDTYVTLTDGTGVVHIAPAFGEDDSKVGKKYDLPFVQLVDAKGEMTKETKWAGMFCKDADKPVLIDLESRGLLFAAPVFEHSYPHCCAGLGPFAQPLLGHAAPDLGMRLRQAARHRLDCRAEGNEFELPGRHRAAPPLHRRGDHQVPGLRRRNAPRARGH